MLKIQYLSYRKIHSLLPVERIQTILSLVKDHKIILIDGRLSVKDEAALIRETMNFVDLDFNGIEIGFINNAPENKLMEKLKHKIASLLVGNRDGLTIIGPAKIISELKQHPESLELYFQKSFTKKLKG